MNLSKHKYKNLLEQINNEPIKKVITFDELYDVAMSIVNKGDESTLKMLKQVYKAYSAQNKDIAQEFLQILKDSMYKENGDIPAFVYFDSKAKQIIEKCYYTMLSNKENDNSVQHNLDSYIKTNKSIDEYNENDPSTFYEKR